MEASSCSLGGPIAGGDNCFPPKYGIQSEDCLFLDIYVPSGAFDVALPVVVWLYGGGYMAGSKTQFDPVQLPFYIGDGIINTTSTFLGNESVIFVTGNYRLGAFGWLAGSYMEENRQPNAGLLDQRAVLQFVQDHVSIVNGDPTQVSLWGESAGASSIMHHLTMPESIDKPPFKKAILQSPAYQWLWDRAGSLNNTFTTFAGQVANLANCSQPDMSCMRSASIDVLQKVNQNFANSIACNDIMLFGPSVDGRLVPDLAPSLFKEGKVAPIDSIVVSHVDLEIPYSNSTSNFSFIPRPIRASPQSEAATKDFLNEVFAGDRYEDVRKKIVDRYPSSKYSDQIARGAAVITESSFTCNTRFIMNYYLSVGTAVYTLDYAVLRNYNGSSHGTDILPLFVDTDTDYADLMQCLTKLPLLVAIGIDSLIHTVGEGMQKYFTNHAIFGTPNHKGARKDDPTKRPWNLAHLGGCSSKSDSNQCVRNLMKPTLLNLLNFWEDNQGPDLQTSDAICQFWDDLSQGISNISRADADAAVERQTLSYSDLSAEQVLDYEL